MIMLNKANQLCRLMLVASLFFIIQCSSTEKKEQQTFNEEKMLVAAGFKYKVAEDDAMLAKMTKLPQHTLIRHEHQGRSIWIYPDVAGCKCIYVGDETNHKRLQQLVKDNKRDYHRFDRVYGSGADPTAHESAAMQELDIDDGMLPGM